MGETIMVKRMENFAGGTVEELIDWCAQRGLGLGDVTVTSTHLRFQTPQTEAERAYRAEWDAKNARRTEEWERSTLARLSAKYGPSS